MKICVHSQIILILTLLKSCRGEQQHETESPGLFESLQNFAGDMVNVVHDVSSGLVKLGYQMKRFEDFLEATVDEDCYYQCSPGEIPVPRPGHRPRFNGCGTYGLEQYITPEMLPVTGFVDCCNEHDICYEICGNDKDECDLRFKKCLYRKCAQVKDTSHLALQNKLSSVRCKAGAKMLYTGTTTVGCKPYLDSQKVACKCSPIKEEF